MIIARDRSALSVLAALAPQIKYSPQLPPYMLVHSKFPAMEQMQALLSEVTTAGLAPTAQSTLGTLASLVGFLITRDGTQVVQAAVAKAVGPDATEASVAVALGISLGYLTGIAMEAPLAAPEAADFWKMQQLNLVEFEKCRPRIDTQSQDEPARAAQVYILTLDSWCRSAPPLIPGFWPWVHGQLVDIPWFDPVKELDYAMSSRPGLKAWW